MEGAGLVLIAIIKTNFVFTGLTHSTILINTNRDDFKGKTYRLPELGKIYRLPV